MCLRQTCQSFLKPFPCGLLLIIVCFDMRNMSAPGELRVFTIGWLWSKCNSTSLRLRWVLRRQREGCVRAQWGISIQEPALFSGSCFEVWSDLFNINTINRYLCFSYTRGGSFASIAKLNRCQLGCDMQQSPQLGRKYTWGLLMNSWDTGYLVTLR